MRVSNEVIFSAADGSGNLTSSAFSVNQVYGWSAQFVISAGPVGTMKAQVSCDPGSTMTGDNHTVSNWSDLEDSSITINGAGTPGINFTGIFYNWLRFVYTSSSGTGTISGRLNLKAG